MSWTVRDCSLVICLSSIFWGLTTDGFVILQEFPLNPNSPIHFEYKKNL